jgi:hypothetical protein
VAVDGIPARTVLADVLRPLLPAKARWQLIDHEAPADDSNRTRVRISQRTISHSTTGSSRMHTIGFQLVVTVPTETLEAAEAALDDDVDAFLHALDAAQVPWTTATKGRYADEGGRLGYTIDGVEMITNPTERTD